MTVKKLLVTGLIMLAGLSLTGTCLSQSEKDAGDAVTPPPINWRDIGSLPRLAHGQRIDYSTSVALFLPEGWRDTITSDNTVKLTFHYHGAIWYAIEEHTRRAAKNPILCFYPGEGSSTYERLYPSHAPFDEQVSSVTATLRANSSNNNITIDRYELESFSAGYGAVRVLLGYDDIVDRTESVVLADSLYASATTDSLGMRVPDSKQMKPFIDFARLAFDGKRKMVVAHSDIAIKSYCSTAETAAAIVKATGLKSITLKGAPPEAANRGLDFPLTARADHGGLHIWSYTGPPRIHMAIARAIADLWKAID
ncbi:MAG: hypothetical protein PHX74_05960 [Candidatus Sumerlaeales bacterium]|nr:hypothetical protein [Candidatus Sumerlaeales bacterium]